ncbi:MAG: hypothetical protein HQL74_11580 [Magnetococcales bacterium]|nr:hypothetical protein [Magnetococcales bacterium]
MIADGSTVSMPDTSENQTEFPQPASQEPGLGFPLTRLVVLISYAPGAVLDMAMGSDKGKKTGEHALLRQILHTLKSGDVLIADCYYYSSSSSSSSYFLIAMLLEMGVDVVMEAHAGRKVDFRK